MTDFYELRIKAGLTSRHDTAILCGVTPRTIRNWEKHKAPKAAISLILLSTGYIDWAGPPWHGWRFHHGHLITPEHDTITAGDIRAIPYLKQSIRLLQNR